MITTATANREHIKSFLRLLLSGADRFHCEIRTVPASRPAHFFCESPMFGWDDTEIDAIADHCVNKNVDGSEVYVTLNNSIHKEYERNEGVRDSHVKYRDWILVDCDPDRTENLATEGQKERARELANLVKQLSLIHI